MPDVDRQKLTELMTRFELGKDLCPGNPFGELTRSVLEATIPIEAFVQESAVRDTLRYVDDDIEEEGKFVAVAIAAFLQGCAIGFDYAKEEHAGKRPEAAQGAD